MKKKVTFLFALAIGLTSLQAQRWEPVSQRISPIRKEVNVLHSYKFDLNTLRELLKNAPEAGQGNPVVVSLPTTDGKVERFSVYSSPVVAKSMAERYELGAYSGVGLDNPTKQVRFSTAPNDFQSMLFDSKTGKYEFIEPINKEKDVYGVFFKTNKTSDGTPFECNTSEPENAKKQMKQLLQSKKGVSGAGISNKNNDQKYRTYRLAVSVNGEYTQLAGGVPGAAARINATINRVNGVYEKDLGIHLIVQDFPQVIFTDPATDPYSNVIANTNGTYSAPSAWNLQVQQTLTNTAGIGNGAYDVGHFFGHRGGGGSAGRVGNVCINPANNNDATSKGAGITSPSVVDQPFGDAFDIDYVAHELGHQLGGRHTMTVNQNQSDVPIEPGSGSTIMGYAGITAANVQMHSDAYFHVINIEQIQAYVNSKTCGITTPVANTPPVIQPLTNRIIPKGTAFVLTANASDAQNDPMTYTWEQYDISTTLFNALTSTRTGGAAFRSLSPTTSPTRYFPKLTTVLSGNLTTVQDWELLPSVARLMNFKVTVRDNNPDITQQQTQSSLVKVDVGNDGPFKVTSTTVYNNLAGAITWDVVNTNSSPYNVQNVKIDYTTDNGNTWTVVTPSTPNDGVEPFSFSSLATGSNLKIRVSAIDNIFYAIGNATVSASANPCSTDTATTGIAATGVTKSSANINWSALQGAEYSLLYRKVGATTWVTVPVSTNSSYLSGLEPATQYEVQIANVCNTTVGTYSSSTNFTTLPFICPVSADPSDEYISNVTVTPAGMNPISNTSTASSYTDYTTDQTKLITLKPGSSNNTISVTKKWTSTTTYNEGVTAWIDFNKDGYFAESEIIFTSVPNKITPVTGTFSVPMNAYTGGNVIMRVVMAYGTQPQNGCSSQDYGEIEDYPILIQQELSTSDITKDKASIQIYPNPVSDVLNVTQVSPKAQFSITNIAGQKVMSGQISDNKISVSRLSTGAYVISIEDKGTISNLKFIKK
ncbi:zinc-dependent metalloprotease family protein [Chryseobacterium tructae]|uniref:Reprolysin-like metallopeptidase n=1 Tax=Chryseobacterium tructae TaxID=1037380 RepID=A0ABV7XZC3_9FLAO|nr:zinc-dependent metalloprotease family protein [Chryseobacterium tructae]MDN3692832.1 zinc-dependent metalloprotease family protein [Chryseobacterium tructae]